ncbi:hypothetical protein TNCV_4569231 [Trichonephila clavipes]|nr:hypothetical protein TNCV_4569231 [Trichonephila clavipes]
MGQLCRGNTRLLCLPLCYGIRNIQVGHGHKFESSSGVTEDPSCKGVDAHYIRQGSKSLLLVWSENLKKM